MKHIKTYENNNDELVYYSYIDITKLEHFLDIINFYNIKYSLFLLKSKYIAMFSIFKTTKEIKDKINKNTFVYIENNPDVVLNIMKQCEDITSLSVSEIKELFDIFEKTKKYNL